MALDDWISQLYKKNPQTPVGGLALTVKQKRQIREDQWKADAKNPYSFKPMLMVRKADEAPSVVLAGSPRMRPKTPAISSHKASRKRTEKSLFTDGEKNRLRNL